MKKQPLFIIAFLSAASVFGQEVIGSLGQTLSNGPLIISQTVGETVIGPLENGASVHQGFHQSNDMVTSISETKESPGFKVYPNPFSQQLFVTGEEELGTIEVFDSNGTLVFQYQTQRGQTMVDLQLNHLSTGHYMIRKQAINRAKSTSLSIIKQ